MRRERVHFIGHQLASTVAGAGVEISTRSLKKPIGYMEVIMLTWETNISNDMRV